MQHCMVRGSSSCRVNFGAPTPTSAETHGCPPRARTSGRAGAPLTSRELCFNQVSPFDRWEVGGGLRCAEFSCKGHALFQSTVFSSFLLEFRIWSKIERIVAKKNE